MLVGVLPRVAGRAERPGLLEVLEAELGRLAVLLGMGPRLEFVPFRNDEAGLSARDALRAATVLVHGLDAICSFDRGFDAIPSVRRLEPAAIR